ncbi:MAG: hypothetical protein Q9207_005133 [Kuettlingeria erythrocarpa]
MEVAGKSQPGPDPKASTITLVTVTCALAVQIQRLIQSVKQRDENLEELDDKVNSLQTILAEASRLYGSDEIARSTSENDLRQSLRTTIILCKSDLTKFEAQLKKLQRHGNWASMAWRHQVAAPVIARIDRSITARHQRLSMLVQLLQGGQLNQIHGILQTPFKRITTHPSQSTESEDQVADNNAMVLGMIRALVARDESEQEEDLKSNMADTLVEGEEIEKQEEEEEEETGNMNGRLVLEAIEEPDPDTLESLLLDQETSLQEKDSKDRTPLLLAAHLGRSGMVEKLLATNDASHSDVQGDNTTDETARSCRNGEEKIGPQSTSHRQIDFNATDNVGRTALHYCAEFDMCDTANLLLDYGVDINAQDNGGYPPAYFAAKNRKYSATKLLLSRGANTFFERPTTSFEIEKLLDKHAENEQSASVSRPRSSRHSS